LSWSRKRKGKGRRGVLHHALHTGEKGGRKGFASCGLLSARSETIVGAVAKRAAAVARILIGIKEKKGKADTPSSGVTGKEKREVAG